MSYISTLRPMRRNTWPLVFGLMLLFSTAYWFSFRQMAPPVGPDRLEMKKTRGRNESHANQNAQSKAEEEFEKAKEAFDKLDKTPNKTKEQNKLLNKLRKKVEHWRKKKDWKGEHHSQKHKGN